MKRAHHKGPAYLGHDVILVAKRGAPANVRYVNKRSGALKHEIVSALRLNTLLESGMCREVSIELPPGTGNWRLIELGTLFPEGLQVRLLKTGLVTVILREVWGE